MFTLSKQACKCGFSRGDTNIHKRYFPLTGPLVNACKCEQQRRLNSSLHTVVEVSQNEISVFSYRERNKVWCTQRFSYFRSRIVASKRLIVRSFGNRIRHYRCTKTPLESVTLLQPVIRPGKILAIGANYAAHAKESISLIDKPPGSAQTCLLYTSPSPRDATLSRMPSSA